MKKLSISNILIVFNLIIVGLSLYALIEEFIKVDEFNVVDLNDINEHEGIYYKSICLSFIIFGIVTIIYELIRKKLIINQTTFYKIVELILRFISYLYAVCLFIFSLLTSILIFKTYINELKDNGFIIILAILIFVVFNLTTLGGLILYNNLKNKN